MMMPQVNAQASALMFDSGANNAVYQQVPIDDNMQIPIDDNNEAPID